MLYAGQVLLAWRHPEQFLEQVAERATSSAGHGQRRVFSSARCCLAPTVWCCPCSRSSGQPIIIFSGPGSACRATPFMDSLWIGQVTLKGPR